jgi:putative sterol carrier protein
MGVSQGVAHEFFTELQHGEQPALRHLNGAIRFDLEGDKAVDSWLVTIKDGDVAVSRRKTGADCIVTMDEGMFAEVVDGEMNAIAAFLRGDIEIEGQSALLLAFQRLFPGPPSDRRDPAQLIGVGNE